MKRSARFVLFLVATGLTAGLFQTALADAGRGRLLYENHCISCHASTVHVRDQRKAVTPAELRAFIQRWVGELKLTWQEQDMNDVYQYLNSNYYKLPVEKPAR